MVEHQDPDLVHVHYIGDWMRLESLTRLGRPVIWSLHDMWLMTGGCHYPGSCTHFLGQCGQCPLLHSEDKNDISRREWQRKQALPRADLTVIACSNWIADWAHMSPLLRPSNIVVIPNGISLQTFRPLSRTACREVLRLPLDRQLLLTGAWENAPRKGLHLLSEATRELVKAGWGDRLALVVVGFDKPTHSPDTGLPTYYLGHMDNKLTLAAAYSAADVFAMPSLEDNLPIMALESIACGTPVVAFRLGGVPDIVEHHINGYLARPGSAVDLASGLSWVLENEPRRLQLAQQARIKAEREFPNELCASRHIKLYQEVMAKHPRSQSPHMAEFARSLK
jgi:glycosyltransferase involved in cell wall biosynthesis